ncbi:transglutaminase-like cysteine peptidase [Bradyrhizobium arachidis]|uniref:transglutaminase-like cysteine peptidase n=1 Tax=Bradyrhizobium arachidis TaxID=858423 RepID=UPI0021633E1C|nr:transglutaminase-like cysteine peptidase [Bradyrhizobium arachidis]UVO27621.1 transglutaminase-like cysteine peptidase [Bradyrhizobium arachidis]
MRKAAKFLAIASIVSIGVPREVEADLVGAPMGLGSAIQYIKFDAPTLPPMAFTLFCLKYENECKPRLMVFRRGRLKLTPQRWTELNQVNRQVNLAIRPEPNMEGLAGEKWLLHPSSGDCNDYAVTKRHELIAKGFPARSVLLSEVVTSGGQHHLVVVVRTLSGDLVLDNISPHILPWFKKSYRWVRIQTPKNPNYWASLGERSV